MNTLEFISGLIAAIIGACSLTLIITRAWINGRIPPPVETELKYIKEKQRDSDKKIEVFQAESKKYLREELDQISTMMGKTTEALVERMKKEILPEQKVLANRVQTLEKQFEKIDEKLLKIDVNIKVTRQVKDLLQEIKKKVS